jgi:integrase
MPVARKSARLWLRPERIAANGSVRRAAWFILDNGRHISTGCAEGETESAERQLSDYIAEKYRPDRQKRSLEHIPVADVLAIYLNDHPPRTDRDARWMAQVMGRLNEFWGRWSLDDVSGRRCRDYVAFRGKLGGARRELEVLRSAINHHRKEGLHREIVMVDLPEKGEPRDRWLTRSEAARLLWAAWRSKETQTVHRGARKGVAIETKRRPLRHLARFILIGLYTGTRAGAIAAAAPTRGEGRSYIDLENGVFYRLAEGKRATNKRQPPVRLPIRLLAHMRRWVEADARKAAADSTPVPTHIVEWNGKAISSVKTGFARAVKVAGLDGKVSPHTLRHTAATWLMQQDVPIWQAAAYVGMSPQMLERVYGHHSTEHLSEATNKIGYRKPKPKKALALTSHREKNDAAP